MRRQIYMRRETVGGEKWRRKSWTSTKVEESKRGAFKGRGDPLEWRRVRKTKDIKLESGFREYNLQRLQSKQEELTEEEEMKQQQRVAIMKDLIKKTRSEGSMDAKNRWWVSELLAKDCEKAWIHTGWEDTMQKWYEWLEHTKKKDEKEKMEEMHQRKVEKIIQSQKGVLDLFTKSQSQRCGEEEYRS